MKVVELCPLLHLRCEHRVHETEERFREWRRERYGGDPMQCQRPARVEVNGRCYCRVHAGLELLEMHLTGTAPESTKLIAKTGRPSQP